MSGSWIIITGKKKEIRREKGNLEITGLYDKTDFEIFIGIVKKFDFTISLQTLDDLLERDKKREEDGFPKKDKNREIH